MCVCEGGEPWVVLSMSDSYHNIKYVYMYTIVWHYLGMWRLTTYVLVIGASFGADQVSAISYFSDGPYWGGSVASQLDVLSRAVEHLFSGLHQEPLDMDIKHSADFASSHVVEPFRSGLILPLHPSGKAA